MPLAFNSLSHGRLPFGFFNVAIDMVLLADHFAFASDFCAWVTGWATGAADNGEQRPFWVIEDSADIGDLHGAMRGENLSGFIGATYARFAFPADEASFTQDPHGDANRPWTEELVVRFSGPARSTLVLADERRLTISIGPFSFDRDGFASLLLYLWRGGMPRWRGEERPPYVDTMMAAVRGSDHWLVVGRTWPC